MPIALNSIMDAMGTALDTIAGLRVFDFVPDSVVPPAAVVSMPEEIEYDTTMARGCDRCTIKVFVLVGKQSDRSARDKLADYMSGTGSKSVKATLESDDTLGGVVDSLRVMRSEVSVMTVGAQDFLGASFDVDVVS